MPLSNLYAASELTLYFSDLPIIDSGEKFAHSMRANFVFFLHAVDFPPITPARFIILFCEVNTQFFQLN